MYGVSDGGVYDLMEIIWVEKLEENVGLDYLQQLNNWKFFLEIKMKNYYSYMLDNGYQKYQGMERGISQGEIVGVRVGGKRLYLKKGIIWRVGDGWRVFVKKFFYRIWKLGR